MTVKSARAILLSCWLGFASPFPALAQHPPTHRIAGRVEDISGGVVTDALVRLLSPGAEPEHATTSDAAGEFVVIAAGTGPWTLRVERPGFAAHEQVLRDLGALSGLRVVLQVDGLQEALTVRGDPAPSVETLRLPSTSHQTPRSLSVIDSNQMRTQNFKSVNDALAYMPGVAINSNRTGGYHFYARGYRMLPDDTRVDGFAGINAGGRFSASLFGIEQMVMLRGPAGLLYGSAGSPGGLVNLVTKKPKATRETRIDLRSAGYSGGGVGLAERTSGGIDLDSTGPLTRGGRVLYRALATVEQMNYYTSDVLDRNRYALGSLTVKLDDAGRFQLTPMAQWTRLRRPPGGGIVVSPSTSLLTNDGVSGPVHTADLSPLDVNLSSGSSLDETRQGGVDLRAVVSPALSLSGAYRFIGFDSAIDQFTPQVSTPADRLQLMGTGTLKRIQSRSETERRYHNVDVNGLYELPARGSWRSLLQAGVHGRTANTRSATPTGPAATAQSPIDIYTGVAGAPLVPDRSPLAWGAWSETTYLNTYVQSQTSLDHGRWVATVGLGYGRNRVTGQVRRGRVTPNGAIVFNATGRLAIYGSYSTSFNPVDPAAENAAGVRDTFDPAQGVNYETGAKYALAGGRGSWTVSVFQTAISNALVQSAAGDLNPNGNRYYAEAGTRRSRGVELSADVRPLADWRLTGSVTRLDAIYRGGGPASAAATSAIPGSRAEKSPEWSWNAWTRYERSQGPLAGAGASLGVVWQAERLGGNGARTPAAPDPLVLPAFTRVDAGLFYRLNPRVDLALNVENLLDETIFVAGTVGSSLEVAAPRTLTFRVGYRFN